MTLSRFRVWTTPTLYAPFTFTEVTKCNVRNIRFENKGLGAAQIDVDLRKYDDNVKQTFIDGNGSSDISNTNPGSYIFIQRIDKMSQDDIENVDYVLTTPWDESVFWWGYISNRNYEVQAKTNDVKGSLDCLEIGHAINKFKVRFPKEIRNGFNPKIDDRVVGNRKSTGTLGTFLTNPADFATNPGDTDRFWTVRQVVDYVVHYGCPFQIGTDWSLLEDSMAVDEPNRWLEQYESIPSYEGDDLTSSLEDILDTLGWTYYWSEDDEEMKIVFFDPIGNMDDEYKDNYYIPKEAKQFNITSEEQAYDRLVLRGNRILVAGSVSTYGEYDSLKLTKDWTDDQQYVYINPLDTGYNYHTLEQYLTSTDQLEKQEKAIDEDDGLSDEAKDSAKENAMETAKKKVYDANKAARELLPNVYQHFKWGGCDPLTPSVSGECLTTSWQPGNWKNEKEIQTNVNSNRVLPFFPTLFFQDPNTTKTISVPTGEIDLLGEPIMQDVQMPKNIDEIVYGTPTIDNALTLHQTPVASEMIFEDTVPWKPYDKQNEWYNKPRFYYRTFGKAEEYGTETVFEEAWMYGDLAGDGLMSSEFTLDWQGIKMKSPQPESFAWNSDSIFQQGITAPDEFSTTIEKFGITTGEWTNSFAISNYDPYRVDYTHKGHWSRLIFSFAARSNQRLTLSYGSTTSTDKTKFEDDDTLEIWMIRKGFVPYLSKTEGVGGDGVAVPGYPLPYYADDEIVKNDIVKAKERLKTLWNFWSKPKKAVQIMLPVFDTVGNMYESGTNVGNFLDNVVDGLSNNTTWSVNSYVASIEYNLESSSPSITVATEYPASPRRTRERRLKSSWKYKRFGDAPRNRGER